MVNNVNPEKNLIQVKKNSSRYCTGDEKVLTLQPQNVYTAKAEKEPPRRRPPNG